MRPFFHRMTLSLVGCTLLVSQAAAQSPYVKVAVKNLDAMTLVNSAVGATIAFAPAVGVRPYNSREAAKWGFDFVTSPSRAKDREFFYGYDLSKLPPEVVVRCLNKATSGKPDAPYLAFVNITKDGPLPGLGGDRVFVGLPVLSSKDSARKEELIDQFGLSANELAPRLVTVGAMRGAGGNVNSFKDDAIGVDDVQSYLAISKEIPNYAPDRYFILPESAWASGYANPSRGWGLSLR
jgi:hypothetical protein